MLSFSGQLVSLFFIGKNSKFALFGFLPHSFRFQSFRFISVPDMFLGWTPPPSGVKAVVQNQSVSFKWKFLSCPNDDLWLVSCQKDLLFDASQVKFFHLQGEFSCFAVILCRVGKQNNNFNNVDCFADQNKLLENYPLPWF